MSGRVRTAVWAVIAVLALSWVSPAAAFPVVFNGPSGFGISAASAADAQSAGFSLITNVPVFPGDTVPFVVPAPDVLASHLVGSPSVANPNTAVSRWSVTNGGDGSLNDAWLVFLTPLTYTASKVGIDLQAGGEWRLVQAPVGATTYYYPAVFLGDLGADDQTTFLMHHVVGQTLTQQGSTLILPQYQIGVLTGVPLPEPATLLLLALSLGLAGGLRRGKA